MNMPQIFYGGPAARQEKLFADRNAATREQAAVPDRLFARYGFARK